ncbi:hypothetical protein C5167_007079 [Papaver somniferum]|uniref:Uncharacterized protein n=1 Tax=Papaver somniferum TaxID=3469 RepID=A0A4Y7JG54_PAPSO|nr:hypothetical protein C5167_007079 [Papaver somniferum]
MRLYQSLINMLISSNKYSWILLARLKYSPGKLQDRLLLKLSFSLFPLVLSTRPDCLWFCPFNKTDWPGMVDTILEFALAQKDCFRGLAQCWWILVEVITCIAFFVHALDHHVLPSVNFNWL